MVVSIRYMPVLQCLACMGLSPLRVPSTACRLLPPHQQGSTVQCCSGSCSLSSSRWRCPLLFRSLAYSERKMKTPRPGQFEFKWSCPLREESIFRESTTNSTSEYSCVHLVAADRPSSSNTVSTVVLTCA